MSRLSVRSDQGVVPQVGAMVSSVANVSQLNMTFSSNVMPWGILRLWQPLYFDGTEWKSFYLNNQLFISYICCLHLFEHAQGLHHLNNQLNFRSCRGQQQVRGKKAALRAPGDWESCQQSWPKWKSCYHCGILLFSHCLIHSHLVSFLPYSITGHMRGEGGIKFVQQ